MANIFQLQKPSDGIYYTGYKDKFIVCRYEQEPVAGKNELYIYRCSAELECCGRECCIPGEAGFPLWLLILILVLVFLLVLALLLCLCYYCWRMSKRRQTAAKENSALASTVKIIQNRQLPRRPVAPPSAASSYHRHSDHTDTISAAHTPSVRTSTLPRGIQTEPLPVEKRDANVGVFPVLIEKPRQITPTSTIQVQTEPPFEPDPMEETMMPLIEPDRAQYHGEISAERPLIISTPDRPLERRAQIMYRYPGYDTVASY